MKNEFENKGYKDIKDSKKIHLKDPMHPSKPGQEQTPGKFDPNRQDPGKAQQLPKKEWDKDKGKGGF